MRRIVVLSVVVLITLSGCSGLGGGPTGEPTTVESDDTQSGAIGGGGDDSDSADGNGDSGDDSAPVDDFEDVQNERQLDDLVDRNVYPIFRPGEYLRYEGQTGVGTNFDELRPAELVIESGDGGEYADADIAVTVVRGPDEQTFEEGNVGWIRSLELLTGISYRTRTFSSTYALTTGIQLDRISDLSVGDTWTQVIEQESDEQAERGLIYTVPRAETYAGVDCSWLTVERYEGEESLISSEYCMSPDIGLPLYFVMYQNDGQVMIELELVEYRR